jgi:hypothetical protein
MKTYHDLEVEKRDISGQIDIWYRQRLNTAGHGRRAEIQAQIDLREQRRRDIELQQLGIEAEARKTCRYPIRSQHGLMHFRNGVRDALLGKYGRKPHTKVAGEAYGAGFKAGATYKRQFEG